jgi:tetratricopeptide (TPR) repeat protein
MKRVNLILTNEQYQFLQRRSVHTGISKAQFLRALVEKRIKSEYFQNHRVDLKPWKLFNGETFNLRVIPSLYTWLENTSNAANCSKSDLIRHIIDLENQKEVTIEFAHSKPKTEEVSLIQKNIGTLISSKEYFGLNKYLSSVHPNEIINLGKPDLINEAVKKIDKAGVPISNRTRIMNAQMSWFLGNTAQALDELLFVLKQKDPKYHYTALLTYGEILSDLGVKGESTQVLLDIVSQKEGTVPPNDLLKAYDKLGLSMYYCGSLVDVHENYIRALDYAKTTEEKAIAYRYLASINFSIEEYEKADQYFKLSETLFDQCLNKNLDEYCRMLITYAHMQLHRANWSRAKAYANKAIDVAKKINHTSNLGWAHIILANASFGCGDHDLALIQIETALSAAQNTGSSSQLMKAHRAKSKFLIGKGNISDAYTNIVQSSEAEVRITSRESITYSTTRSWQYYLDFLHMKDVPLQIMHMFSKSMNIKNRKKDESINNYVLGYLYYASKDPDMQSKGSGMLKRLHEHTMNVGDKKIQFAIEGIFKFNQFSAV